MAAQFRCTIKKRNRIPPHVSRTESVLLAPSKTSHELEFNLPQGDGGWEPKCKEEPQSRRGRGKKRRSAPGTEASGSLDSDEETDADVNASVAGVPFGR